MTSRSEQLVAEAWRLARGEHVLEEAVLEVAFAAALEVPETWPRLVQHFGWKSVSATPPTVSTQDVVPGGRTDITLTWPTTRRLALELKVWDHPAPEQVQLYLDAKLDVVAVAALFGVIDVKVPAGQQFLGVVTWRQIHAMVKAWPEAPLVVRQFASLLEGMGVAMPKLSLAALQGVAASWDAWSTLEDWIHKATGEVEKTLTKGGLTCVRKDGPKNWVRIDERREHRRYVGWTWPSPWKDDEQFGFCAGLRMGSPELPPQVEGLPELMLCLHVSPTCAVGKALRTDVQFDTTAKVWCQRTDPSTVIREWIPGSTAWSILRARASAVEILYAEDQGERLASWMRERAQEWVDDGVIARAAALHQSSKG